MKKLLLASLFALFFAPAAFAQTPAKKNVKTETAAKPEFEKIKGSYKSDQFKDEIAIYANGGSLMWKIAGRPSLKLVPAGENTYKSDKEKITMSVDPQSSRIRMEIDGSTYVFSKV